MKKTIMLMGLVFGVIACDDIAGVTDISEQEVIITAPANNALIEALTATFTWEAVEEATGYHLQVAIPSFTNATQIVVDTSLAKLNYTKTFPASGDYEWRIRAENSGYVTAYTLQQFTIEE